MNREAKTPDAPGRNRLFLWIALLAILYAFFVGLEMMGLSFKLFGRGFAEGLIARTANPFSGLVVGLLATSLVQSSSTTTSMTVALVAGGALTIEGAIPIIMGANIGTSVTNTIVSLGHVTRKEEFRRAFAGATIHDFFNFLSVLVLLPLEIAFGFLNHAASIFEKVLEGVGGDKVFNPLKAIVEPAADGLSKLLGGSGAATLIAGLALLFLALRYLVRILRVLLSAQAEAMLHNTLFRSPAIAILAGAAVTAMVQSSSVTTSVMVPLVGAGVISLVQLFPFTIGANIGTTVTAMIASLATGSAAAITIALTHFLFNVCGMLAIYCIPPVRRVPLWLASRMGDLAVRNRGLAVAYILLAFYVLPILLLFLTGGLGSADAVPALPPGG